MKRILWLFMALVGLLLAACGSEGNESSTRGDIDGLPGQAPPVATPTVAVQTPTADLGDRLGEMILGEDDVPAGLSSLGSMGADYDLKTLGVVAPQGGKAQMTMFASPDQREIVVSMVILLDDASAVEEELGQIDNLTLDQIRDALAMAGNFGGITLLDLHQLDVSGLGETAAGFGLTMELPQVGVGDGQWVFFGRDSLLAMVMTMGMGGSTPADAVPLAEVMDAKIKGMRQ